MLTVVISGRGKTTKLHAQTADGRRLCQCKYRDFAVMPGVHRVPMGTGCDKSALATTTLPGITEQGNRMFSVRVLGLGMSLTTFTKAEAVERLQAMGFGAYRYASAFDAPVRRVRPAAEQAEEQALLMSSQRRYWGD